jgi:hypothetical protein
MALSDFTTEQLEEELARREREGVDPNDRVWGVYVYGFDADAILPPGDWPAGVPADKIRWSRLWRGTLAEAQARIAERDDCAVRKLLGNARVPKPLPKHER